MESRAFAIWLSALSPANLVLVGLAGLLSLFAGASILTESALITPQQAGLMAVFSAALTLIHNRLKCEPHQAECRRLRAQFNGLKAKYESLLIEPDEEKGQTRFLEIDAQRAITKEGAMASPARWCLRKAQQELHNPPRTAR